MICSPHLQPVRREEIIDALVFAMCSDPRRARVQPSDEFAAHIAAKRLARHLKMAGFVVMKETALYSPLDGDDD
jgi:hypothetical protein